MKRRRHGAPILEQNVSECSPSAPVGEIDNPLAGTRPLFEERAKIVTARSISSASRTSIGLTSTPNADGFIFFAMASLGAKIAVQSNHTHDESDLTPREGILGIDLGEQFAAHADGAPSLSLR